MSKFYGLRIALLGDFRVDVFLLKVMHKLSTSRVVDK